MAKNSKEVKVVLIGGHYRPGSTLGNLFSKLSDGKYHKVADLVRMGKRTAKNPLFLLRALKRDGEKKFRQWKLNIENGAAQMKRKAA